MESKKEEREESRPTTNPKYPDVCVLMAGQDGNAFADLGSRLQPRRKRRLGVPEVTGTAGQTLPCITKES